MEKDNKELVFGHKIEQLTLQAAKLNNLPREFINHTEQFEVLFQYKEIVYNKDGIEILLLRISNSTKNVYNVKLYKDNKVHQELKIEINT